jgi:hypothetical protein
MMCYAFNEEKRFFLPLGPNSKVKFVKSKKMSASWWNPAAQRQQRFSL